MPGEPLAEWAWLGSDFAELSTTINVYWRIFIASIFNPQSVTSHGRLVTSNLLGINHESDQQPVFCE